MYDLTEKLRRWDNTVFTPVEKKPLETPYVLQAVIYGCHSVTKLCPSKEAAVEESIAFLLHALDTRQEDSQQYQRHKGWGWGVSGEPGVRGGYQNFAYCIEPDHVPSCDPDGDECGAADMACFVFLLSKWFGQHWFRNGSCLEYLETQCSFDVHGIAMCQFFPGTVILLADYVMDLEPEWRAELAAMDSIPISTGTAHP